MYVRFMIPQGNLKVPLVLTEGCCLSGKSYETTPDGRMGWDEYFVRNGYPVYKPDVVSRAASGFDQSKYNDVQAGVIPPASQSKFFRLSDEESWLIFRFGPTPGVPFPDTQFPVASVFKFSKQTIPFPLFPATTPSPTPQALSDLAIQLNGAVVFGHSGSGLNPLQAALINASGMRGLIVMEPATCNSTVWTDQQIATFATVPILTVFGDHLYQVPGANNWPAVLADCQAFVARVNAAGGNATMLHLPDAGLKGNSHMFMLDKNNLQVADLIIKWINDNVGKNGVLAKK
jgi:hypothetical protein